MKGNKLLQLIMLNLAISGTAIASSDNVSIIGSIPAFVPDTHNASRSLTAAAKSSGHYVMFEHILLSPAARQNMANSLNKSSRSLRLSASVTGSALPSHIYIGMNDVPVLDQGQHGTCATFANTAALDAVLGHTDYISQLCNLDLGTYLSKQNPKYDSGWDGTLNTTVMQQITTYGIVPMSYQVKYGCGASTGLLKTYPLGKPKYMGSPMSDDEFTRHSEKIMANLSYNMLLKSEDALQPSTDMDQALNSVKQALNNGHRVVVGTLIDEYGSLLDINGAQGTNKANNDSWIMVPQIVADIKHDAQETNEKLLHIRAGHALVVIGYDDNAVINGPDGNHKGVLFLRNSWSEEAGNSGEYYMSYDFFSQMVTELIEIVPSAAK